MIEENRYIFRIKCQKTVCVCSQHICNLQPYIHWFRVPHSLTHPCTTNSFCIINRYKIIFFHHFWMMVGAWKSGELNITRQQKHLFLYDHLYEHDWCKLQNKQHNTHIYYVKTKFRGCVQKLFSVPNYSKVSSDSLGHLFPQ